MEGNNSSIYFYHGNIIHERGFITWGEVNEENLNRYLRGEEKSCQIDFNLTDDGHVCGCISKENGQHVVCINSGWHGRIETCFIFSSEEEMLNMIEEGNQYFQQIVEIKDIYHGWRNGTISTELLEEEFQNIKNGNVSNYFS